MPGALSKLCTKCGVVQPLTSFAKSPKRKDGLDGHCKSCKSAYHARYRYTPQGKLTQKKAAFRYLYDLSLTDWERLFNNQNRQCAICRCDEPRGGRWTVDHDHVTDKVRGILCNNCNLVCGLADDNEDICLNAAAYLHPSPRGLEAHLQPEPESPSVYKELNVS